MLAVQHNWAKPMNTERTVFNFGKPADEIETLRAKVKSCEMDLARGDASGPARQEEEA